MEILTLNVIMVHLKRVEPSVLAVEDFTEKQERSSETTNRSAQVI